MANTSQNKRSATSSKSKDIPLEAGAPPARGSSVSTALALWLVLLILVGYGWWLYKIDGNPLETNKSAAQNETKMENSNVPDSTAPPVMENEANKKLDTVNRRLRRAFDEIEFLTAQVDYLTSELENWRNSLPEPTKQDAMSDVDQAALSQLQTGMDRLREQVETLKRNQQSQADVHASKLRSLQLADKVETQMGKGEPYSKRLAELQALADSQGLDKSALEDLALNAETGILTLAELTAQFNETAALAIPVSLQTKENPTLGDKVRSRLGHVVSIRRVGGVIEEEAGDEAIIARAEQALHNGNVSAALAQIELLSAEPAMLFHTWKENARAYEKAWNALERIKSAMYAVPEQE